jgi:hypothetical protein
MLATTTALMVGPGAVIVLALGFRRPTVLGLAPEFSVGIAGAAAVIGSAA